MGHVIICGVEGRGGEGRGGGGEGRGLGQVIILGVKGRKVGTWEWRGGGLGQVIILGVKGRKVGTGNNLWSGGEEGWDR